ncbi:hypothetical protein ACJJIR_07620 [Microbulbifer sp. SSSA008]|uniref:hypothetical protein n=1 Tax=Microbulbifer sp. SSSA008 TaxID=3243380 RepID=UPI004039D3E2
MLIQYTPTRSLVGDGSNFQIEAKLKRYDGSDRLEGKEHKALSGQSEYTVYRLEEEYVCQTVPLKLTSTELARWREFKRSCAFGEFFTFDAYGTSALADDPQQVQLKFKSFKEKRQKDGRFIFSFTTVQVIA